MSRGPCTMIDRALCVSLFLVSDSIVGVPRRK